ncbi:hemolymph lipopolysaccharide-binding protein-like [Odontomachus brunneus]|uniref:hemolymph lipopolysaccharide-binding protein-like n=1 Tax=Odontomachus brunneus TaxID=486640 RepID=UPI0013F29D26|nr:hemolymph lipopolysaccharide-binding protein-like [Odontomachus brunneus]
MFKYLAVVLVLSHGIPGQILYPGANEPGVANLSVARKADTYNCSAVAEELSKKPTVTMNGNTNYHVGQQIFYVYGEQQFRKLFGGAKSAGNIENDYLVTEGIGAHKLHRRKVIWNKARRTCIEEGGHLAIINSASEEKILLRMMQEKSIGEAWLGLHDLYEEGDWVTITDEALENTGYSKWSTKFANLPDNYGGSQNCAVLLTEGGIDDISCTITQSFFCEISL